MIDVSKGRFDSLCQFARFIAEQSFHDSIVTSTYVYQDKKRIRSMWAVKCNQKAKRQPRVEGCLDIWNYKSNKKDFTESINFICNQNTVWKSFIIQHLINLEYILNYSPYTINHVALRISFTWHMHQQTMAERIGVTCRQEQQILYFKKCMLLNMK